MVLAYADHIVLIAKTTSEIKEMIKRFEIYLEKKMILSSDKTKIVEFNRKERSKKKQWKWRDQQIEQVKEVK